MRLRPLLRPFGRPLAVGCLLTCALIAVGCGPRDDELRQDKEADRPELTAEITVAAADPSGKTPPAIDATPTPPPALPALTRVDFDDLPRSVRLRYAGEFPTTPPVACFRFDEGPRRFRLVTFARSLNAWFELTLRADGTRYEPTRRRTSPPAYLSSEDRNAAGRAIDSKVLLIG